MNLTQCGLTGLYGISSLVAVNVFMQYHNYAYDSTIKKIHNVSLLGYSLSFGLLCAGVVMGHKE